MSPPGSQSVADLLVLLGVVTAGWGAMWALLSHRLDRIERQLDANGASLAEFREQTAREIGQLFTSRREETTWPGGLGAPPVFRR